MLTTVNSPFIVHINPQDKFIVGSYFDIAVWVNTTIVRQKNNQLNLQHTVIDFIIRTHRVPCDYNIHIGSQHETYLYKMAIEKTEGFLCFKVFNVPVLSELNLKTATLKVSLLSDDFKNHFQTCMPFLGCITHEESLR